MSKLSKLKERAAQAVNRGSDNLGPDRGTMDQEEARIERAKAEARREAKREKVQQRAEEARERERERVLNEEEGGGGIVSSISSAIETAAESVDDNGSVGTNDLSQAFGTDFDGDGEPLAEEIGLQSAARGRREDQMLQGLSQQADRNTGRIGELEDIGLGQPGQRGGGAGRGGGGGIDPEEFGMGGSGGFGSDPVDPEEFGFGGSNDDFFGGGGL